MSQRPEKRKQRRERAVARKQKAKKAKAQRAHPATRDAAGRLHLVLHRDPSSGRAYVTLKDPLFSEAWQNEVAVSAANTAYASLATGLEQQSVVALARHAMDATSRLGEGLLARAANGAVACRPGCDHCCYQSVGVTPAEALAITVHLKTTLSSEELAQTTSDVAKARERTRGLSSQERFSPEHPCPFLKNAQCSIYEVRPLSCRGMNSLDADECARNLRDPEARADFLAAGRGGRSFMEPIRAFHAISAGLQLGLSELFQLDMRPLDLTAAVHELLSGSETLAEQWLRGEPSLEGARGGDSSDNAVVQELSGRVAPKH